MSDSNFHEPDYAELKAKFLEIQSWVNSAESQFEMYNYATSTWPKFCKEMLRVVLELENEVSHEFGVTPEAVRGIEDDEFLNS